ncbi:hypothetical protein [Parerythrobacter aestuarii]|uniref:hypothetical protein n=1 Tax=Parerythrobacter aestuarii TaxID=3020909 RepID=UPI0024DE6259|nr:hypothetical protein [Parerythrobacter aestuarii]
MNTQAFAKTIAAASLAAVATLGIATPAHAANSCRNVALAFTNDTEAKINIVDVDYWDPAKGRNGGWRSEPVINETLEPGTTWRETRNLEKVNARETKIRFEYRIKGKLGGWSFKKYKVETNAAVCNSRTEFLASVE